MSWNEVKRISGHTPISVKKDMLSILALDDLNVNDFSNDENANLINDFFFIYSNHMCHLMIPIKSIMQGQH